MGTLTDEDLTSLLGEAAASFDVPEDGPDEVRAELADEAEVVPLRRRRWVQVPAAAAVVTLALLAGSVWGGAGTDGGPQIANLSGDSGDRADERYSLDQSASGGATGGSSGEIADGSGDKLLRHSATGSVAAPQPAAAPGNGAAQPPTAVVPDGARVVKTGAIALIVEDGEVTPTLTALQGFATAAGGVVANAKTQESGPTPSGSVTLRVPVDSFEEVVTRVRSMGAEVRSATTSGQDVTAQYADLEAQLVSLKAARERFLEILSNARTIGDVLAVQQRVDDVTGKIDRLEGQRRVLAAQSDTATLEVTVTEDDDPLLSKQEKPDDGIGKAFSDAWDGFTSGIEGLIRHSGRALVVLLVVAAGWAVLRLGWRASRRRLV